MKKKEWKKKKKNWPGDHDSKNQLPWALEKRYTTVSATAHAQHVREPERFLAMLSE